MAAIRTYYALSVPTGLLTLSLGHHRSRSIDPWIYVRPNHPWFRQNDRICRDRAKRLSSPVPLDRKCSKPSPTRAQERIGFNRVPPNTQRLVSLYTFSTGLVSMPIITIGARKDTDTEEFRIFKRGLMHRSIATILFPLRNYMTTPCIIRCPDQHFRRAIFGLGPHISDYPEQATLGWILLNWCPTYVMLFIEDPHQTLMRSCFKLLRKSELTRYPVSPPVCDSHRHLTCNT
jgi:hypothetical protein